MRQKDEFKQEALFHGTIKLVNKIGFVSSSVSKIAKEAGISPATVYIYFKNKEDLLVSIYLHIKKELSQAMLKDFDPSRPFKEVFRNFWYSTFSYTSQHKEYIEYTEQFAHSPFADLIDKEKINSYFLPFIEVLSKAIEEGIVKNTSLDILQVFMIYPVILLSNPQVCGQFEINETNIESAFDLAWDAVRVQ